MECVYILIEADSHMNCYNAAEAACAKGHLGIVQLLVEHQPHIIDMASSRRTPCLLHAAILASGRLRKLDVLSFLLEKGVSPNTHPPDSACALATALLVNGAIAKEMIQLLIKAGADVNKLQPSTSMPCKPICAANHPKTCLSC